MKRCLKNVNKKEIKGKVKPVKKEPLVEEKPKELKLKFNKVIERMSDPKIQEILKDIQKYGF